MKFLMISSFLPSVLSFRGKLLEAIHQQGYEIHIIAPDLASFPAEQEKLLALGYCVHEIPMQRTGTNLVSDLKTLGSMYTLIKKIKPDYVLSYTIKPVIYGTLAAWLVKVPYRFALITGLGYAFQNVERSSKRSLFQKVVHSLYREALSHTHKVIFQNSDDANLFKEMKLVDPVKINIVNGSGVDLSHYNYDLTHLTEYTLEKPLRFLMLGRLIGDKGIREYIAAAIELKRKYGHKVIFQLGGDLDTNPTAIKKEELDEWISSGVIEYLGKLKDVRPAITNSHVFVLPSYREGTSRSILEAMSIGRPIVTTNVAGCRQLVEIDGNGYLAEAKSVNSLVQAIENILNLSSSELVEMGAFSRKIVEQKYNVSKVNKHMLDIMGVK